MSSYRRDLSFIIDWMCDFDSKDGLCLFDREDLGIQDSIVLKKASFNFSQLWWVPLLSMIEVRSKLGRIFKASSKSALANCQICLWGLFWEVGCLFRPFVRKMVIRVSEPWDCFTGNHIFWLGNQSQVNHCFVSIWCVVGRLCDSLHKWKRVQNM